MKYFFAILFTSLALQMMAQDIRPAGFTNNKDIFGTRVFIENKGQFDNSVRSDEKVLYAYEHGDEHIYFTKKGLVYKLVKPAALTEEQMERAEHGKAIKPHKKYYINMTWGNASADLKIESAEEQSWYFTYGAAEMNSGTYKKLTYKNVYPNIDIEYIIPEDKDYGIKYSVILHPFANPTDIKIIYSGDVKITQKGNEVIVKTPLADIIEHAPHSFYSNKLEVASVFTLQENTIGFDFPEHYDRAQTLIIDPWVTGITTLGTNNHGYDVDYDYAGNLYVYGGGSPNTAADCKIAKYSPTGALLWTFPTTLPGVPWNNFGLSGIPGNFVVNRSTQKVYTGETFGCRVIRLTAAGAYDNFMTPVPGFFFWNEFWEMGFNPCTQTVYAFGGGTSLALNHAAIVDEVNMTSVPVFLSGPASQPNHDISCCAIDDNGAIFLSYTILGPNPNATPNFLLRVNPAFTSNTWSMPTTFSSMLEYSNKPAFSGLAPGVAAPSSNGLNCLAVNGNYLFFYDGFNLAAYNKTTGGILASTTLPGYTALYQSGIAVDDCDHLYVGGNGMIHVFQFTGTAFTILPNIPLNVNTPQPRVFDLKLDKATNLLYASGRAFVGTYNATQTCTPNQIAVTYSCGTSNNAVAVASVTPLVANSTISYTWANAGGIISQAPASPSTTHTLANLANGIYTVVAQLNAPCGPVITNTVSINCPLCSVTAGGSVNCIPAGNGFSLAAGNPVNFSTGPNYSWTGPGGYSSNLANPSFTNGSFGIYTLTATNATCAVSLTVALNQLPPLALTIQAGSPSACVGSQVVLTGNASGGTAPYAYSWSGGPLTSTIAISQAIAGTYVYTLSSTDAANCSAKSSVSLLFLPSPTLSVNNATICEGSMATLLANGADSYLWLPGNISGNPYGASPHLSRTYTVVGTSKGCQGQAVVNVVVTPAPKTNLSAQLKNGCAPFCLDLSVPSSTNVTSYDWYIDQVAVGSGSISNYCFKSPGHYAIGIVATDNLGCKSLEPAGTIQVYPKPIADFIYSGEFQLPNPEVMYVDASYANIANWYWYFGDGEIAFSQNPKHSFKEAAIYNTFLVVENIYGCKDTVSKPITIEELPVLFVPNTFTPNEDGDNDAFFAKGTGIKEFKLQIFNRWGQKIFEANDITKAWDGTFKGVSVKEDTYVWLIHYSLIKQNPQAITGHVNLIR
jgi:gliding motility-associated-like protein